MLSSLSTAYSWTRREPSSSKKGVPPPSTGKRRSRRSVSPGRSRSPAESYYSRRSYRSRSRSVDTPKRRRRDDSPPRGGRSPHYQEAQRGRDSRRDRRYSRSPISSPRSVSSRGRGRRRDASTSSYSRSRSRSPSRSPRDRPKAVHRLPQTTSIKDITIAMPKFGNGKKKGKGHKNANGKLSDVSIPFWFLVNELLIPRTAVPVIFTS